MYKAEWNLIRLDLGGPAHGIVTKTVHKTLPGGGGGPRGGWVWGYSRWWGPGGVVWSWGVCFDMKLTLSV